MPKATPPINNFNGGEVFADLLDWRFDNEKYKSACRTFQNALPMVEGGARKLPGSYYVDTTKNNGVARFEEFRFNEDQNYVIEFGNQYIRIFTKDGALYAPTEVSDFDPAHSYSINDKCACGMYWTNQFSGSKELYFCAGYGQWVDPTSKNSDGIKVVVNSSDSLHVTVIGGVLTIKLANTTASKNTAVLIQAAVRAYKLWGPTHLDDFTVTGNDAYDTAPPVSANTGTDFTEDEVGIYIALGSTTGDFPPESASDWGDSTAIGDELIEITSPYATADLFDLDISTQIEDTLFIFHPSYQPRKLQRISNNEWDLVTHECLGTKDFVKYGEYYGLKPISTITKANPAQVTCVNHGYGTGSKVYINGISGMVELNQNYYTITYIDADNFTLDDVDSSSFNEYAAGGYAIRLVDLFAEGNLYPACGTIHEQRLIVGGSNTYPMRVYGSAIDDYGLFVSDPEADDFGFVYDIKSKRMNRILWFGEGDSLMIGTAGGIMAMYGSNEEPLSLSNVNRKLVTSIPVSNVAPEYVNDTLIFATRSKTIVRAMQFISDNNKWVAPDLTRVARHITKSTTEALSGIKQFAYQDDPYPILWALRNDGVLLGMTFESQESVFAWFRVVTDGEIESIAVIPYSKSEDRLWMIVKRVINSATKRYVEYMKPFEYYSVREDAFFVHSGLTYDGSATTTITGLSHLEGESVAVLADGVNVGPKTVSSGQITLSTAASKVHVGMPYDYLLIPLPPHLALMSGTSKTKKQVINRVAMGLFESAGGEIGTNASNLLDIPYPSGYSASLFTGEIGNLSLHGGWDDEVNLYIKHSEPLPFTVKGIVPDIHVNEY